jgi:hypothetical protein
MCKNSGGGGVAASVFDRLAAAMWIEIRNQNNIFLLCVLYRSPNMPAIFWDKLQER